MARKVFTPTTLEQRRAQAQGLQASITAQVAQLHDTEGWLGFCQAASHFHTYSWRNILLILHQYPTASQVAAFRAWQKMGRQVHTGEHGIKIFGIANKKIPTAVPGDDELRILASITGYLFNMAQIFEDFVTVGLGEALDHYGGRAKLQYRTHLDEQRLVSIRPDLVWLWQGRPHIVVDAKYKAEKPAGFPQADLYQLLAYCTVLGLPAGHLVYAKGNEDAQQYAVRNAGVTIIAHNLDLQANLLELLASVDELAERMWQASGLGGGGRPILLIRPP